MPNLIKSKEKGSMMRPKRCLLIELFCKNIELFEPVMSDYLKLVAHYFEFS